MQDQMKCNHTRADRYSDGRWRCYQCSEEVIVMTAFEGGGKIKFNPMPEVPTLRDQFAMAAMQGLFSASYDEFWVDSDGGMKSSTQHAYKWADWMLEARKNG